MIAAALTSKTTYQALDSSQQIAPELQKASAEAVAIAYRMMALSNVSTWNSNLYQAERSGETVRLNSPSGEILAQGQVTTASDRLAVTLDMAEAVPTDTSISTFDQLRTESIAHLAQTLAKQAGTPQGDYGTAYDTGSYSVLNTEAHLTVDHADRGLILESFGTTVVQSPETLTYSDFEHFWEEAQNLPETEWQLPPPLYSMSTPTLVFPDPVVEEILQEVKGIAELPEDQLDSPSLNGTPQQTLDLSAEYDYPVQTDWAGLPISPATTSEMIEELNASGAIPSPLTNVETDHSVALVSSVETTSVNGIDPLLEVEPQVQPEPDIEGQPVLRSSWIEPVTEAELQVVPFEDMEPTVESQSEVEQKTANASQVGSLDHLSPELDSGTSVYTPLADTSVLLHPERTQPTSDAEELGLGGGTTAARSGTHPSANVDAFTVVEYDRRVEDYVAQPVVNVSAPASAQDRVSEVGAVPATEVDSGTASAIQASRMMAGNFGQQEGDYTVFTGKTYKIEQRGDDLRVFAEGRGEILNLTDGYVSHSLDEQDKARFGEVLASFQRDAAINVPQPTTATPVVHLEPGWTNQDD